MTTESVPLPFTVSRSTGQIYSGTATNSVAINVTLPSSFAVLNDTVRDGGVCVHATDASRKLTVYGMNNSTQGSTDGFVALPCHDYQKQNYTYYAVSTYFGRTVNLETNSEGILSEVLLVGCEDSTELTITPTQTIEIPSDLARGSNFSVTVSSGGSYTVTLDRLQTFLLSSTLDLTGAKVVSNKPIAFFSGHECADVPVGVVACDHLVEQLPPTLTWGRQFFLASSLGQGNITLFITTTESAPVPFTVSSSTGQLYSGTATNSVTINVTQPSSFAVFNETVRDRGVWVRATDASKELTVYGMNNNTQGSTDGFVALPCHDYQKQNYTYYAVSTYFGRTVNSDRNSEMPMSEVLLVGCKNDIELTITPTQTIEIPSDLVRGSNSSATVSSGGSYTITLDRLQTFLFSSMLDLTGSMVVSNKPIAFFSGHECADVPVGVAACDHLVEQLPPTLTWGRQFFVVSLLGKTAGEQYKLVTSAATTTVVCYCYTPGGRVSETFIITLNGAGRSHEFHISQNMFCSLQASNPVLLVQFAIGAGHEPSFYGDPFMMMIPPVEQYSNNYTFVTQSGFQNAITVTVHSEFFNSEDIILNGDSLDSANWTEIYCSTQSVCGYGTRVSVSVERNFIYHRAPTSKIGTFVYGFRQHTSYGYPAGMQLIPISGTVCSETSLLRASVGPEYLSCLVRHSYFRGIIYLCNVVTCQVS